MLRPIAFSATLIALLIGPMPVAAATTGVAINGSVKAFVPATVTIGYGNGVAWTNNSSSVNHTATADLQASGFNLWDVDLAHNSSAGYTSQRAGSFAYHCEIHHSMRGTVNVTMSAQATATIGEDVTIGFATVGAPSGFTEEIQKRKAGGTWKLFQTSTGTAVHWTPQKAKTFQFRARFKQISSGKVTGWSPTLIVTVSHP